MKINDLLAELRAAEQVNVFAMTSLLRICHLFEQDVSTPWRSQMNAMLAPMMEEDRRHYIYLKYGNNAANAIGGRKAETREKKRWEEVV